MQRCCITKGDIIISFESFAKNDRCLSRDPINHAGFNDMSTEENDDEVESNSGMEFNDHLDFIFSSKNNIGT